MRPVWILLVFATAWPRFCQVAATDALPTKPAKELPAQAPIIPERSLKFSPVATDPSVALSPVTSVPQCSGDGTLFLDMLDPTDLKKHTLVSIKGKESRTYSPAAISDLRDLTISSFFASESMVAFLVRGTREMTSVQGAGRSPAGFPWSSYHSYIAPFKRDGTYQGAMEIPVSYQVQRFAILPSGEILAFGYDRLNAAAKLLLLDSSASIVRTIDTPQARSTPGVDAPFRSTEAAKAEQSLVGPVAFTPYNQDILMWRRNNQDPILDIGPGGRVREVPLEVPAGFVFVDMVPAKDRWIARFRKQETREDAPFTKDGYAYYELRPQDASPSAKLLITGDVPQSIACEADNTYMTYKMEDAGKLRLYESD